jgi:hypothetical protein
MSELPQAGLIWVSLDAATAFIAAHFGDERSAGRAATGGFKTATCQTPSSAGRLFFAPAGR